jgi:uncharacterized protein involved in exopolysaccharide biosynthesis
MAATTVEERSLRDIVALVNRNRRLLIVFIVSAMVTSLVLTYVFSQKYQAATIVMYRPTDTVEVKPNVAIPDKTALGFPVPALPFEAVGETINRIGKSERVLRKVVVELGLDQPEVNDKTGLAWLYTETKTTTKEWLNDAWQILKYGRVIHENPTTDAIIGLMKYVTIDTRDNYTTTIAMVDKDPERAALIVDRVAEILVDEVKELSVSAAREQAAKLTTRLADKESEIKVAQGQIEQLKSEWDFDVLDNEMSLRLQTMEEMEAKLLQNEIKLATARATLTSLNAQRGDIQDQVPTSQTVEDDPLYGELQAQQALYRVEADSLLTRLGPKHRNVLAVMEKINSVDAKLANLGAVRVSSEVSGTNPTYEELRLQEIAAKAEVEGLAAENTSLQNAVRQAKARLITPQVVSRLESLELNLKTLKDDYTHIAAALEEAKTAELTNVAEVRVLFDATPIHEPVRPIKIYHVALSGILALALGVATVFIFDFGKSLWNAPLSIFSEQPRGS